MDSEESSGRGQEYLFSYPDADFLEKVELRNWIKSGNNLRSQSFCFLSRKVEANSGIDKCRSVFMVSVGRIVIVLVEAASTILLASITCARRPIPSLTPELYEVFALGKTFTVVLAVLIVSAFSGKGTLEFQLSMKLDLLSYGRIILSYCLGNRCLG